MKETLFKNKLFYKLLIGVISILLVYNIYVLISGSQLYTLIPVILEVVLLILIFTKNQYARIFIMIWAVIGLLIAHGSGIIANLMDDFDNHFVPFKPDFYIEDLVFLAIGVVIIAYTKNTVVVVSKFED